MQRTPSLHKSSTRSIANQTIHRIDEYRDRTTAVMRCVLCYRAAETFRHCSGVEGDRRKLP